MSGSGVDEEVDITGEELHRGGDGEGDNGVGGIPFFDALRRGRAGGGLHPFPFPFPFPPPFPIPRPFPFPPPFPFPTPFPFIFPFFHGSGGMRRGAAVLHMACSAGDEATVISQINGLSAWAS